MECRVFAFKNWVRLNNNLEEVWYSYCLHAESCINTSHVYYYSVTTGKIIENALPNQLLSSATTASTTASIDLLECLQWQLEWSTTRQTLHAGSRPMDKNISLILRCIPKSKVTDEAGDILVAVGLTLYSGKPNTGKVIYDIPSSKIQPIRLTKQAKYRTILIHDPNIPLSFSDPVMASVGNSYKNTPYPYGVRLSRFDTHISAKVVIINMGRPLSDSLRDDFGSLLNKDRFSDVTLVASRKKRDSSSTPVEFPAHKVILAARSPVFASMFEHKMQENSSNQVEIDDIYPNVVKVMLTYIYTGRVSNINEVAYGLFYAADKYQLDQLKTLCEEQLSKNLKVENAAHIIQLAHMHNAPLLKRNTLQFISDHGAEVRATKEWEEVKQCADILDELLQMAYEPPPKKPRKGSSESFYM